MPVLKVSHIHIEVHNESMTLCKTNHVIPIIKFMFHPKSEELNATTVVMEKASRLKMAYYKGYHHDQSLNRKSVGAMDIKELEFGILLAADSEVLMASKLDYEQAKVQLAITYITSNMMCRCRRRHEDIKKTP